MSFANIKTKLQAQEGFTIVELLIVIVVIAILAAITIVSYNGITARANSSSAQSMAAGVAKKAEAYAADATSAGYPPAFSSLNASGAASTPYGVSGVNSVLATSALNSTNGKNTVQYTPCGTGAATTAPTTQATVTVDTGAIINYWDFSNNRATNVTAASPATTATDPAGITVGQVTGTVGTKTIGCPTS